MHCLLIQIRIGMLRKCAVAFKCTKSFMFCARFRTGSSDFIHENDEVMVETVQYTSTQPQQVHDEFQPETDEVHETYSLSLM